MRVYNFSAGPSMLPMEVLEEAGRQITDYEGSGMSVMELSHRGKVYEPIHDECIALIRELMGISEEYEVLLLQGGASTQFESVPLNLLKKGRADYVVTGNFSKKAYKEAMKYGDIRLVASSEDAGYTYIPKVTRADFRDDIDYVHITENNTIFGTKWAYTPDCGAPLVSDMSSCIMSEVTDVNKYALIYAGAQKNLAPAMMLNMRYLKKMGGVPAMEKINREKAGMLYDFIDNSSFYTNKVNPEDRSLMNVPFVTPSAELDAKFVKEAEGAGLVSLKGHRLAGGMRASIYNAMPVEGVKALIDFMKKFETENK